MAWRQPAGKSLATVYVQDEGAVYDAPLSILWDYLLGESGGHAQAHRESLRNLHTVKHSGRATVVECEVHRGGRWWQILVRTTEYHPVAVVNEELEGPYAGSTIVFVYTPVGSRTRVDAYAHMVSDVFSPRELENHMRQALTSSFLEDEPLVRAHAREAKARRRSRTRTTA